MDYSVPEFINEQCEFPSLQGVESLHITFEDNRAINSSGIAKWISWIESNPGTKIFMEHVSVTFLHQASMVSEMLPENCSIISFKVPYYSEKLQEDREFLFYSDADITLDSAGDLVINKEIENQTEEEWELDLMSDRFFDPLIAQLKL